MKPNFKYSSKPAVKLFSAILIGLVGATSISLMPVTAQTPGEQPPTQEMMSSPEPSPEMMPVPESPSEEMSPSSESPTPDMPQAAPADPLTQTTQPGNSVSLIGLAPGNVLVRFGPGGSESSRPIQVRGVDGNLQGIDVRPANGLLYGVSDTDKIYTINLSNGAATQVGTLTTSFDGGFQSGFDFNPQLDRLRINSLRQNFSVNVDNGATAAQTALAYIAGDRNAGRDPNVTAAAYTNNVAGATSTQLFTIDYDLDALVLQDPPPTGQLRTIGSLGVNFSPIGGFDIATDAQGINSAFAISGSTLFSINLQTGRATRLGAAPRSDLIGLAAVASR
jgi:Domain of unknown function (DUF4394)